MNEQSVNSIIENYKSKVKELGKDPSPGHNAIVVYGGYMGKSYHTLSVLNEIGLDKCYPDVSFPYNDLRKDWIHNIIQDSIRGLPIIILDSYWFPYVSCKEKVPEFVELIKSIPEDKFGFTLNEPYKYINRATQKNEVLTKGFFEIKSNLIFLVGYTVPKDLIDIMPSFNFNFDGKQLLVYIRENVDTIFPKLDNLTHEIRLETVDLLDVAYEKGVYETFDFKWIKDAFEHRYIFEKRKKTGETSEDFNKDYGLTLRKIKDGRIK
jgi:hypothetical protein